MKSRKFILFVFFVVMAMILGACKPATTQTPEAKVTIKVVNLINGTLGDKSFFDSANRGVTQAQKDFNLEVKTIEAGNDPARWQPALEDAAANEDYDVMVLGTWQMAEFLQIVAPKYPEKKFIIYDTGVDYTACDCKNVYSVEYKQNEGSYLAGLYAGLMTKTGIIGAVGGMDIPIINDFIIAYKQGAKDAGVAEDKIIVQFAGSWSDPAKGKEIALAMYQQGADIIFQVAAGTGEGVFAAAQELGEGHFAIGVDSDQALAYETNKPEFSKIILTSMMKNVDNSLYRALKLHLEGKLVYGSLEKLGVAELGVGLARNKFYDAATPQDVKAKIDQAEKDIISGKIVVDTAFK
jgi:basic membrane protein A